MEFCRFFVSRHLPYRGVKKPSAITSFRARPPVITALLACAYTLGACTPTTICLATLAQPATSRLATLPMRTLTQ